MDRTTLENYKSSLSIVKAMLIKDIISNNDYKVAEIFLAKKYCIKKGSIYRSNDLILSSKRVMYSTNNMEVKNGEKSNENRHITEIRKET